MDKGLAIVLLIGGGILAVIGSVILNGYALSVLWSWFIVPVFGLPALTVPVAIGLAMVIGFLTHQVSLNDGDKNGGKAIAISFLKPLLVLLFGWIVKQWM